MAPPRIQAVLALEIETGKAAPASEHSRADCTDGTAESDVGAGPRRFETICEARYLRLATDGAGVLALGTESAMAKNLLTPLADVRR